MLRLVTVCLLLMPSVACAQGYQLKYVPIPPKQKAKDEPLPADKRPVARYGNSGAPLSRDELAANWQTHNERMQARWAESDRLERERVANFNEWERQHAADNLARAAAQPVYQPQYYQYSDPSIVIVQPWDNIRDYWGIYSPGRHNQSQTYLIYSP